MRLSNLVIVLNLVLFLTAGCNKKEEARQDTSVNIQRIKAAEVLKLHPVKNLNLPGELRPWNKVSVYSRIKGYIKEVKADRGSLVKKGQVLAVLDAPEVRSELDQAHGQLYAAEAALNESRARFSSSGLTYKRLLKASSTEGAIAANELDQAMARMLADSAAVSSARGNFNAAKSHYQTKTELVNYLKIIAPFDGQIIERNISPGELIGAADAGSKPLFVLEDNKTLRLTVAIPEIYSNSINKNSKVTFKVNSVLDKDFAAIFGRSAESVVEKNRVMMAEYDVDNRNNELKAGMYAEVVIPIKRAQPSYFVPRSSIVNSSEKVFIIKASQNKSEWIPVKKGMSLDSLTEIFGDVNAGDLIVKEASEELREGQLINLSKP